LHTDIELAQFRLANDHKIYLIDAFERVLPQDIGHVVVVSADPLHVAAHVEEEVGACWILHLEGVEFVPLILSFNRYGCVGLPLSWNILVYLLFVSVWKQRALLGGGLQAVLRLLEVDADVGVVRLPVEVHVQGVLWMRVDDLIHAHAVLAEDGRVSVGVAEVPAAHVLLLERGVDVALAAYLTEGRCQLELGVEAHAVSQSIRAQHIVWMHQRSIPLQNLTFVKSNLVKLLVVEHGVGIHVLINVVRVSVVIAVTVLGCLLGRGRLVPEELGVLSCEHLAISILIIRELHHPRVRLLIQLHIMVELLRIGALVIADGLNRAALAQPTPDADIRDVLEHALHCLLVRIVVFVLSCYHMVCLLSCPHRCSIYSMSSILLLDGHVNDDVVGLVEQGEVYVGEIWIQRVVELVLYAGLLLLEQLDGCLELLLLLLQILFAFLFVVVLLELLIRHVCEVGAVFFQLCPICWMLCNQSLVLVSIL